MSKEVELFYTKDHTAMEKYLYKSLASGGFTIDESYRIADFYMTVMRSSSFTKTGTYGLRLMASEITGKVRLVASGRHLRNRKDITLSISELTYKRPWWLLFLRAILIRT